MNNILSAITFTILLVIIGVSPFPSIPIALLNYKMNGLLLGYLATLIAGTISSIIYYKFANYIILKFIQKRFKKKYYLLKKYSYLISEMTFLEFILLLFAGVIPNSIISIAAGLVKMNFRKFIISYIIVGIPQQLILLFAATQIDSVNKFLNKLGFDDFTSLFFTLSIVCFLSFLLLYIYKNISILKNIFRFNDR